MKTAIVPLVILVLSTLAFSATYYVPDDYNSIQNAITAVSNGDMIIVKSVLCHENIDFIGKAITVKSENGSDFHTIDGDQKGSVVTFSNGEGPGSRLEGFLVTNGTGTYQSGGYVGGGIYCYNSSPTITNNTISGNTASYYGGGIYCTSSSSPTITNNTISGNTASYNGGGMYSCGTPTISNNTIAWNTASVNGGGIYISQSPGTVVHDMIFWTNDAPSGPEIYVRVSATFTISYSDVDGGLASVFREPGSIFNWGPGMIDADPMFISGPDGDYYLEQNPPQSGSTSPCVNSGSDTAENLGMDTAWTRTDEVPDSDFVDMGFHYGQPSSPNTEWAILVYLNGDNNLEAAALDDFIEMAQVGSTSDFNIIVQLDRHPFDENFPDSGYSSAYGDWWNTRRFVISSGMTPDDGNEIMNLGEANMGQGTMVTSGDGSLEDFVLWASENYPARKTALVLWDHGDGWRGDEPRFKSAGYDMTDNDFLYMAEVRQALENVALAGYDVNLLGFDSCLMGMLEVAYEIRNLADVLVGSEMVEPTTGWPYDTILADLASNPQVDAVALGRTIVTNYSVSEPDYTMSALDLSKVELLSTAVNTLALEMTSNKTEIATARGQTQEYDASGGLDHVDLYDFAYQIILEVPPGSIYTAAVNVMNILLQVVIESHGDPLLDNGIAIYFPSSAQPSGEYCSDIINFARDTYWDEFLRWYHEIAWLYYVGDLVPGSSGEIRITGERPNTITLATSNLLDPPLPTMHGDLYLTIPILKQWLLGGMPIDNIYILPVTIPSTWISGEEHYFQALVGKWGYQATCLTNLLTVKVE